MEDEAFSQDQIMSVASRYFPFITVDNFHHIFKYPVRTIGKFARLLKYGYKLTAIRNILILLFHLKNYLPLRAGCIIFGIQATRYFEIIEEQLEKIFSRHLEVISLDNRKEGNVVEEYPNTYSCLDGTEIVVESQRGFFFSGKANHFTIKYQVLIGAQTGEILHIYGPLPGSTHDLTMLGKSGLSIFMGENNEKMFADKGYISDPNVITPSKKRRFPFSKETIPRTTIEIEENKSISHYRILIENVNASIKQWNILSGVYRGDLKKHFKIFTVCCVLINLSYY